MDDHIRDVDDPIRLLARKSQILMSAALKERFLFSIFEFNGWTWQIVVSLLVSNILSMFQTGYHNGIVNTPEQVLKRFMNASWEGEVPGEKLTEEYIDTMYGLFVASFSLGAIAGSSLAGFMANKFGRKSSLFYGTFLALIGVGLQVGARYSDVFELMIVGRLICGINAGLVSVTANVFVSEIATKQQRGYCVSLGNLSSLIGTTVAMAMGMKVVLGTDENWQFAIGLNAIPPLIQLLVLPRIPESPRFLFLTKNNKEAAIKALKWYHHHANVEKELSEIADEHFSTTQKKKFTIRQLWRDPTLHRPFVIAIAVTIARQFSGFHVIVYYSTSILLAAGLDESFAQFSTLFINICVIPTAYFSGHIVDRAGRKKLLLFGYGGVLVSGSILSAGLIFQDEVSWFKYVCIASMLTFSISCSIGPVFIPKLLSTELFTQGPRAVAVSAIVSLSRTSNVAVSFLFPVLLTEMGRFSFLPFVGIILIFIVYAVFKIPETKGKSYSEISLIFTVDNNRKKSSKSLDKVSNGDIDSETNASYSFSIHL